MVSGKVKQRVRQLWLRSHFGSFFEVVCIKVGEAQRFGFNEALWLVATGRATREALLSEAGFEGFRTGGRLPFE